MNLREILNFWRLREAPDWEPMVSLRYYVDRKGRVVITSVAQNT